MIVVLSAFALYLVYRLRTIIAWLVLVLLVVPLIEQTVRLVNNLPEYVADLNKTIQDNSQLPMVGATLAAVAVGIVVAFSGSTGDLIVWIVFTIVYQQFENYVLQPRIQSRAVSLDPFIVVLAALIGGTLLGVLGALLAIPGAATIQIATREYLDYRRLAGAGNA